MSGTLRVVARLTAKPGMARELETVLSGLVAPTRREAGCISYVLHVNEENPGEFVFIEEWKDGASLEAHFRTDHIANARARFAELLDGDLDVRRYRVVE